MAEIQDLIPDLSTDLTVFTLNIGHRNLSFCIGFVGLCHNYLLICYFPRLMAF